MRIAIYGAGSLGTVLGAYLAKAGIAADLIARNRAHVDALNRDGAHITGTVDFIQPVRAFTPDQLEGCYDLIFFLVKQTGTQEALTQLKPHLSPDSIVCTLQNGLPEAVLEDALGADHVVGCTVEWGAEWKGPGVSELTSEPTALTFSIGKSAGVIDNDVLKVRDTLSAMGPTTATVNLMGIRWSKLLINSMLSGMSAVTGATFGEVAAHPQALSCAQEVANECIRTAKAAGVVMEKFHGVSLSGLLAYRGSLKKRLLRPVVRAMVKPHRLLRASMLQDLEKGKPCEIDAINGAVCRTAARCGIATPYNDAIVAIIREIETGKAKPGFENLSRFPRA